MEPSPTKNLGTATLKKKAAKKWKREKKATAVKRKAADTEQMESTTPGPAEKKLIIGQTPAEFLALKADPIIIPRIWYYHLKTTSKFQ